MTRQGPRRADQVRGDSPAGAAAAPEPTEAPAPAAEAVTPPAAGSSRAWQLTMFVWLSSFAAMLVYELLAALFRSGR
jgi:hypothetical protein